MKKLLIMITIMGLIAGCATAKVPPNIVYPHDFIPVEVENQVTEFGYTILGSYVSDTGGIVVFVEGDIALLYIPYASDVYSMTHDEAIQVYQELCLKERLCNDNPYMSTGEEEEINEI